MGEWYGWLMLRDTSQGWGIPVALMIVTMAVSSVSLVSLLVDAIQRSGLSEKEACYAMDLSPSQWANQKTGNGNHVSMQRASRLPAETLQEFALLIVEACGLPKRVELGAAILLAQKPRMVMAKAELRQEAV